MAPKKGRRRNDSSDEEAPLAPKPEAKEENVSRAAKRDARKKKGGKAGARANESSDDDVDPLAHLRGKTVVAAESDDSDPKKKPLTKKEKRRLEEEKKMQAQRAAATAGGDFDAEEEEEEEDTEPPPPAPPAAARATSREQQPKGKSAQGVLSDGDEGALSERLAGLSMDGSEPAGSIAAGGRSGKGGKAAKGKVKGKDNRSAAAASDDDEGAASARGAAAAASSAPTRKGGKGKGGKRRGAAAPDSSEDEAVPSSYKGSSTVGDDAVSAKDGDGGGKKGKGRRQRRGHDSDEEAFVEVSKIEESTAASAARAKTKGKKGKSKRRAADESEEEDGVGGLPDQVAAMDVDASAGEEEEGEPEEEAVAAAAIESSAQPNGQSVTAAVVPLATAVAPAAAAAKGVSAVAREEDAHREPGAEAAFKAMESDDGGERGGGKKRLSKADRKKLKSKKKGGETEPVAALAEESAVAAPEQKEATAALPQEPSAASAAPAAAMAAAAAGAAAGMAVAAVGTAAVPAAGASEAHVAEEETGERNVVLASAEPAAAAAPSTAAAPAEEVAAAAAVEAPPAAAAKEAAAASNATEKKKEKKTKLQKKLEEAAKAKAEAERSAGLFPADAEEQARHQEEKAAAANASAAAAAAAAVAAAAQAEREKKEKKEKQRQAMLEYEVEEPEYYGSDHEEERARGKGGKAVKEETVEEELERLVAEAEESSGKRVTGRQRKKLQQDIESRRRAAEEERREAEAHREGAQFAVSQTAVAADDPLWQNSLDVSIDAFTISAMDKTLFRDSPLSIVHGRKYGLVGPNGAGKSTLLKMIASESLRIPPRVARDCLYVEQEVVADDTPAVIAVMKADKERWALIEEERRIIRALRDAPEDDKLNDRLQAIHEQQAAMGADSAEAKARRILWGLGFDEDMQIKPTRHFSGGWRMRISLARALFMEPTLLMLDEPTNHLDLNAVIWLDDYLQKWKKTLLVVSHDQDFLNSVCEEILHLEDQKVVPYRGNYDTFKEMEAQKRKQRQKDWEKQQRRLVQLKKSGGMSKGKAEDTVKKTKAREPGASKKKQDQAVAAGTGEVQQAELLKRPKDYVVTLQFPDVNQLTPPIIEVMDVKFRYGNGPWIFKECNFGIDMSSRICIVGPNGAGKTTLLKLLTGDLEATDGDVRRNPRLRAGIYNQHFVDRLPMDTDPVSYLRSKFPDDTDYQSARNLLGRFGLEGHAHTIKMHDLSGGQKARVVFCELALQAPHILFLDEPTNNLDIESIDALCDAVKEFNGGVVVVTHDARLIESTDCRLWIVDKQEVLPWAGEFSAYKEHLLKELEDRLAEQEAKRLAKAAAT